MKARLKKLKQIFWTKRMAITSGAVFGAFVLVNLGLYITYQNRSYATAVVGNTKVGSVSYNKLAATATDRGALPQQIELKYQDKTVTKSVQELGVSLDAPVLEQQARKSRSWLPIINVFKTQRIPLQVTVEDTKFTEAYKGFVVEYQRPAEDAKLSLENGTFAIKEAVDGRTLDEAATKRAVQDSLSQGNAVVELPVSIQTPAVQKAQLEEPLKQLQAQQNTSITLTYNGKTRKATPQEVASWYVADGPSFVPSTERIRTFVQVAGVGFGIGVQNLTDVTNAIKAAVSGSKPLEVGLVAAPIARKTYTYCLATRGVDASYLAGLNAKLLSVYSDPRGWGLDGLVKLQRAETGCVMTVWLSAASQMSSFGAICDSDWSCRVGANVVLNFDRWQGASAAWNAAGGSLDDYRSMVINHETGHWFGFYHADCGGAGQSAPVMQQQSISLQGCVFNPWPLASERAALKRQLGI